MHALTQEAAQWWARTRADAPSWIANYQASVQARHRDTIVEVVARLQPETVLEVGCHCGPNLIRLAKALPETQFVGIDVNRDAIEAGKTWLVEHGVGGRVQLHTGRLPDRTDRLPSGAFDVVLSCYTLAYIAPADLDAVLFEMGRLAGRALVVAEPMVVPGVHGDSARSVSGYSEWRHDYQGASPWIGSWRGMTTTIVPVEPPVDRLNAILVAQRDGSGSTPSSGPTP